ncbi:permease of the drug/metabolite transporter superfamily [Lachnospiraceae bacterium KM106-2]|nr:permease of the drug/metabolite transporter superfamily [Lachnospiraceae bacterium KM106-2]
MTQKNKGILSILMAAFFFALMNIFVKASGDLPFIQKSFFRNLIAMMFAAGILIKQGGSFRWKKGNLPLLLLRSTFGFLGILGNFYAVDHLVVADASMLNKMSPFFGILFSAILLKERCSFKQAIAVIVAFIGGLFVIKPTFQNMEIVASLAGFGGGMAAGLAYTLVRALGKRKEHGPYIVFFFSAFSTIVALPYLLLNYAPMTGGQLLCLLGAGFAAAGGQFSITAAYCYAPAKDISIYDYSQIIFSAILGFFIFGQVPDKYSILGYVIIISMAVYIFIYNRRQSNELKENA